MTPRLQRSNSKGRQSLVDLSLRRVALLAIGIVFWISACSQTEEIAPPASEAIAQPEGAATEFAGKIPSLTAEVLMSSALVGSRAAFNPLAAQVLALDSIRKTTESQTSASAGSPPSSSWYWNAWTADSTSEGPVFKPVSHLESQSARSVASLAKLWRARTTEISLSHVTFQLLRDSRKLSMLLRSST